MKQDQNLPIFFQKSRPHQNGQAVVEYILLAVVVVGLIMGARQIFTSLNDGFNRYIGDYTSCLMEYGELPSLGVREADLKKHEASLGRKCEENFDTFTFAGGRPFNGGGGGGANGSGSGSSSSGSNGNNSPSRSGSQQGSSSSNNSSNADGGESSASELTRNGSGARRGAATRGAGRGELARAGDPNGVADGSTEGANKKSIIEDEEEVGQNRRRRGRRNFYSRNDVLEYRAVTGKMAQQIDKQKNRSRLNRKSATIVRAISNSDGELKIRSNRKVITPPEKVKDLVQTSNDGQLSFGSFIRWLLIAAMILAIVVFFGGQIMNYQNSKE